VQKVQYTFRSHGAKGLVGEPSRRVALPTTLSGLPRHLSTFHSRSIRLRLLSLQPPLRSRPSARFAEPTWNRWSSASASRKLWTHTTCNAQYSTWMCGLLEAYFSLSRTKETFHKASDDILCRYPSRRLQHRHKKLHSRHRVQLHMWTGSLQPRVNTIKPSPPAIALFCLVRLLMAPQDARAWV
jgi:hypothetical protein